MQATDSHQPQLHCSNCALQTIDTSQFNWLDFDMGSSTKEELLKKGMEVGLEFLKT